MNYRNTIQRNMILEAAQTLDHPTADQIFWAVRDSCPNISRGTVYRNLGVLVEQDRLQRIASPGADHYDITLEGHHHAKCRICNQLVDIDLPVRDLPSLPPEDARGFLIEGHHLILWGICPSCRAAGEALPPSSLVCSDC